MPIPSPFSKSKNRNGRPAELRLQWSHSFLQEGPVSTLIHLQAVGEERRAGLLPILELDDDRTPGSAGAELLEPPPPTPGSPKPLGEALREEREDVEDGRLPTTVGPQEGRERSQFLEVEVLERTAAPDLQLFDPWHGW